MQFRFAIALFAVVFFGSIVVNTPASLLVEPLARQHVFLEGVSGSIWHGRAQSLSARANGEVISWGRVQWQLSPLSLVRLAPSVKFSTELGSQWLQARVQVSHLDSIQLTDVQGRIPAGLVRLFAPLSVDGAFEFNFPSLLWSQGAGVLALEGALRWIDGVWITQVDRVRLGTYQLTLQSQGEEIVGTVSTEQGAVKAAGEMRAKEQNYTVDLLVEPSGPAEQRLRQNLSLIAQPEGRGLRIKLSGQY